MSGTSLAIAVGDSLPPFVRRTGLANWNRYAAVNYEFVDIHMDDDAGRAAGYDSAFGMGNLSWSYLHSMLREWLGEHGRIASMQCQFRGPNIKGAELTARGMVTEIRTSATGREADLDIWIEDQDGTVLIPGKATVAVIDRR